MGWSSGSSLMCKTIEAVERTTLPENQKVELYGQLIAAFEDEDWDTQNECEGRSKAFDEALLSLHPDWK